MNPLSEISLLRTRACSAEFNNETAPAPLAPWSEPPRTTGSRLQEHRPLFWAHTHSHGLVRRRGFPRLPAVCDIQHLPCDIGYFLSIKKPTIWLLGYFFPSSDGLRINKSDYRM